MRSQQKSILLAVLLFLLFMSMSIEVRASTEKQWQFRVYLDDKEIGYHRVWLVQEADRRRVSVEAHFDVKFFFITAYRYEHRTEEIWQGSCLADIQSRTDDNGNQLFVRRIEQGKDFALETHEGEQQLEGCVRSFAYWDPDLLQARRLLNTQTGEYQDVQVNKLGASPVEIDGRQVDAIQYRLVIDDYSIDLWYTPDMEWLALQSTTEGGYRIRYLPAGEML
jgi:hypothetical protein